MATDQHQLASEHFDLLITSAWHALRPPLVTVPADVDTAAGPVLDIGAGTGSARARSPTWRPSPTPWPWNRRHQ